MNLHNKKIGIWGFGVVGKAALHYFSQQDITTNILDAKTLTEEEKKIITSHRSTFSEQKNPEDFFQQHDLILASPGIDLRPFAHHKNKFITELDIFYQEFKKPIIAVTGTVGKTSITHLLSTILSSQKRICTGGNIGTGMLELLQQNTMVDGALLELSSFQLEHCTSFAPDLAIWTNFYPNHLDRHGTLEEYFNAKCKILTYQKKNQQALIPLELAEHIKQLKFQQQVHFFSVQKPSDVLIKQYSQSRFFWIDEDNIMQSYQGNYVQLTKISELPSITFAINWLVICASLELLGLPQPTILTSLEIPAHRVEKIATINGVEFYNDSKATIMEATLAAVQKLQGKPILLFLGGISKGVDRTHALTILKKSVSMLFCFGKEAEQLHQHAQNYGVPSSAFPTLEAAFENALQQANPGDQLLFSPSGASYDLFAHYVERGERFKKLVLDYKKKYEL